MKCSSEDLAWLAGILDGEGSVCLYENKGHCISNVQITNTDDAILTEVERILQSLSILYGIYSAHTVSAVQNKPRLKPCFHLTLTRQLEQKSLLEYLLPYIRGEKKEKAIQLIQWIDNHERSDGKASNRQKKFVEKQK